MSKLNKRAIENIKTTSLVVLSLSTILLLYFFWWDVSIDHIKFPQEPVQVWTPTTREVTKPDEMVICFGGNNYSLVSQERNSLWDNDRKKQDSVIKEFQKFGQAENILVEEIPKSKYIEAMNYRSLQVNFFYSIPFLDFCEQYSIKKAQAYDSIETISSIGYSEGSKESLFLYDGINEKHYRLFSDSDHTDFSKLIKGIEDEGYEAYYPLGNYLGVDNSTIVPLSLETQMTTFHAKQDLAATESEKINQVAEKFFGESFDFIRKITEENGTIIYMYGYGEKIFIVNPDGSIDYKEQPQSEKGSSMAYFDALNQALEFVATHGKWESFDGIQMNPYVKDVTFLSGKQEGYRFTFGDEANGGRIFYEKGQIITVEIIGGQVTSYQRDMLDFEKKDPEELKGLEKREAFSAVNVIAQNYEYIYEVLVGKGIKFQEQDGNTIFEDVSRRIKKVRVGYLRTASKIDYQYEMKPVWVVSIENVDIYFNLYDATPIAYSSK